jgi:CRP-like cAMP-binding protein
MAVQQNRLLSVFPHEVAVRLTPSMRTVELSRGEVIHRPGQPIESVYFPVSCLISVTVKMIDGSITEAGLVGSREMVGINAFMGGRETNQTEYISQVPGQAIRVPAEPL